MTTEVTTGQTPADDDVRKPPQTDATPERPEPEAGTPDPGKDPSGRPGGVQGEDEGQGNGRPATREARYRLERNEARAERDALRQRVEKMQHREVARLAGQYLADGADLLPFSPISTLVDDNDDIDPDKVADAAAQMIEWRPGFARGARVPTPNFGQGRRTPVDQGSGVTWGAVLRGHD